MASSRRMMNCAKAFVVIGVACTILYAVNLFGRAETLAPACLGFLLCGVAVPAGIYFNRPSRRVPWILVDVAGILLLAASATRTEFATLGNLGPTRSLIPDALALPGYLVLAIGLTMLARTNENRDRAHMDMVLDGFVAALAALSVAWVYLIGPVLFNHSTALLVRITLACYPALDVYLVLIAFRMGFDVRVRRTPSWRYLLEAVLLLLVGDLIYMLADIRLISVANNLIDIPYLLALTAFGACVLHPSMKRMSEPRRSLPMPAAPATATRLALVACALLVPIVAVVANRDKVFDDRVVVILIAALATAAATWRVFRALRASATSESRLAYQATHDALTGLPNRILVEDWVTWRLNDHVHGDGVSLIFLDIDRFKLVNDTFGHSHGDLLLIEVARRLESTIAPEALVARIGGDEFVVVVNSADEDQVRRFAERIRLCFNAPFSVSDSEVFVSASVGVAITGKGDRMADAEMMIRDADTAMYQAKEAGRDTVAIFDASMRERIADRLKLEHDLRLAVDRKQFWLAYQPIMVLGPDGVEVVGLEALLRWAHPTRGLVPPDQFIAIAEDSGLIVEIGDWVIHEACRQLVTWRQSAGAEDLFVSVNLSAIQLTHSSLFSQVRGLLAETGLPASALCLELTESLLMDNPAEGAALLVRLKELGVQLSIDDFGTGYSSLAYLKQFPVDYVKIDKSFVDGLNGQDTSDETLVAAIVSMARALDAITIAEGVELRVQEDLLRQVGCDMAQGFFYARPVSAASVPETLRRLSRRRGLRLVSGDLASLLPER